MTRDELAVLLGREPGAEDQPPGWYRYRARRGAPLQAVKIAHDNGLWFCFVNGYLWTGARLDPAHIPFIFNHGPFHAITEKEYMTILKDYAEAEPGSPYETPNEPVNVRQAKPL